MEFSIHFPFILKKKVDFWMKKERWKLYLFIEDIAFKSNNFSKFLSVKLPLRPCKIMDPKEKSLSTGALLIKALVQKRWGRITVKSPQKNELKMNWKRIDSLSNEWWIELIHLFSKWMVNWIDSLFFEMNGELNDSPKNGEWTQVCLKHPLQSFWKLWYNILL